MNRINNLVRSINGKFPVSSFSEVTQEDFENTERQFGDIPSEVKQLYTKLGYGCIGDGYFQIHFFLEPIDIYDVDTAQQLDGILIVGDDFAGTCYAYDSKNNWTFGCIESNGKFEPLLGIYSDFIDFLEKYILDWDSLNISFIYKVKNCRIRMVSELVLLI